MPGDKLENGGSAPCGQSTTWAKVYDELRSQQSLASVTNDPCRGSRLLRGQWDGLTDFVDTVWESVEEYNEQRQDDGAADAAVLARIDALIGEVPTTSDFRPYLDTFTDVWEVYHRNHRRTHARRAVTSDADSADPIVRRSSSRHLHREGLEEDEASTAACEAHFSVPHEYFSASFSLEHHQIFRQSLETSVEKQEDMHAELMGHLDLVEVSLFEHIRRAQRDQLFDSLASLGEPLQQDLSGALTVIRQLRSQLRTVQQQQLRRGIAVGRLARRKQRVQEVLQRLDCLAHVRQCQPSIQVLLQGHDFVTALDLMESTTSAVDSSLQGVVSIKPTLRNLGDLGDSFDRAVEAEFVHWSSEALLQKAGDEAHGNIREATSADGVHGDVRIRRLCQCLARREHLRSALNPTLRDVFLSHLKKAIKACAKALLEELTQGSTSVSVIEQEGEDAMPASQAEEDAATGSPQGSPKESPRADAVQPSSAEEGASAARAAAAGDGATAGISSVLSALSFDGFLDFWQRLMGFLLEVAGRFKGYSALVQEASKQVGTARTRHSDAEVASELLRLMEVTVAQSLKIAGALLQARQNEHQRLKLPDWQRFLSLTNNALEQVRQLQESCCARLNPGDAFVGNDVQAGLRIVVYNQTKSIIEEFHQKCLLQTKTVLDQEPWDRIDVPVQYKRILARMLGQQEEQQQSQKDVDTSTGVEECQSQSAVERYLHVEGQHFLVVPAVLTLLQLLGDYVQLCQDFGELAADVVQRMCMLLRSFNQRAHRLVLSGQAVSDKVLKKITAANLALSSQCCGLMAQILPLLQTHLAELTQSSGIGAQAAARGALVTAMLGDLSTIASEYSEHRSALFGKLSDLLRIHYEMHSKKWLSAPHQEAGGDVKVWQGDGAALAKNGELDFSPHEALEGLVKDVTAMYRVLLKNLNFDSVRKIFARAFEEIASRFEQRLGQELAAPSPPYSEGPGRTLGDRLLFDLAFLQKELEKLTGISTPLQRLLCDLVQHLQAKLPADPLRKLHPNVLEVLQRAGRLPK
eukprot:TRINITY_DN1085_c0_g1_i3.p1 TRINITY_DN1085_c0_g1~~TRINITY_DN1085_c0_g1_i3.p1  ORF type:complete len:1034 (+),score=258.40 TRINITY_DN1085_c0_g1_i3:56-3157(+)